MADGMGLRLLAGGSTPDERARRKAAEVKAKERKPPLPPAVADVRERLLDAADRQYARRRQQSDQILRAMCEPVIRKIAAEHGTTYEAVMSRHRYAFVVRARHHAIAVVRWSTGLSLPALGRVFFRDYTTILSAVIAWERILNDPFEETP